MTLRLLALLLSLLLASAASAQQTDVITPLELLAPGQQPNFGDCPTFDGNRFLWQSSCGGGGGDATCHKHQCSDELCFEPRTCDPTMSFSTGIGTNGDAFCAPGVPCHKHHCADSLCFQPIICEPGFVSVGNGKNGDAICIPASGGGGSADCESAPTLFCLDGRADSTNDPLISTDDTGRITGSDAVSDLGMGVIVGLTLNAHTDPTLSFNPISLNENTTELTGANILMNFQNDLVLNDFPALGIPAVLIGLELGSLLGLPFPPNGSNGIWTIGDDSTGGLFSIVFGFAPTITNPTGVAKSLGQGLSAYQFSPILKADDAADTFRNITPFVSLLTFDSLASGTLSGESVVHYDANVAGNAPTTLSGDMIGFRYLNQFNPGALSIAGSDIALQCGDSVSAPGGVYASLESTGPNRVLRHEGPASIGDDAAPLANDTLTVVGDSSVNEGHIITRGTAPILSSCGTSPSVVTGNDNNGNFTTGTLATGCVLTFNAVWTMDPDCVVVDETTPLAVAAVPGGGGTTLTISTATAAAISGQKLRYICRGAE